MDLIEVLWKQDVDLGLVTDSLTQDDESFSCLKSPLASSVTDEKHKKVISFLQIVFKFIISLLYSNCYIIP